MRALNEYNGEAANVARSELDNLELPSASLSDGADLFEQVARCRELVDRLRIGALELRCGVEKDAFDVVLASELTVLLNVALTKCRNVLDQVSVVLIFECSFFVFL